MFHVCKVNFLYGIGNQIHIKNQVSTNIKHLDAAFGHRRVLFKISLWSDRFLSGSICFEPAQRIWKTWAPQKCKFFIWLATLNKCWTADRLARRGLDYPYKCPLCDQQDETIQHILVSCVFAGETWTKVLIRVGLLPLAPDSTNEVFQNWWRASELQVPKTQKKGLQFLGDSSGMVAMETQECLCLWGGLPKHQ